jgi:hypothetical protein
MSEHIESIKYSNRVNKFYTPKSIKKINSFNIMAGTGWNNANFFVDNPDDRFGKNHIKADGLFSIFSICYNFLSLFRFFEECYSSRY